MKHEQYHRAEHFALSRLLSSNRQEGRDGIFLEAQREIAKMLAENLLSKFEATTDYKEVAGELLFEAN